MFGLMVSAGPRVEEVTNKRLADLDGPASPEQMAWLRVRGKGHKERIVWITPQWYSYVQAWLAERPGMSGPLHRYS